MDQQELFGLLDQWRSGTLGGPPDSITVAKLQSEPLSPWDALKVARFLSLHSHGATLPLQDWLASAISDIASNAGGAVICDPWAGMGGLAGVVAEATGAKRTVALARTLLENEWGRALHPTAEWVLGDPFDWLNPVRNELDVVASLLPMNLRFISDTGRVVHDGEFRLIVAACAALRSSGVGIFTVRSSFFREGPLELLSEAGLGLHAAFELPSGTWAPSTNLGGYLIVVRPEPAKEMFIGALTPDPAGNAQVLSNFFGRREGPFAELGRFVPVGPFPGIHALKQEAKILDAERALGKSRRSLREISMTVAMGRPGELSFPLFSNCVFIPLIGRSPVITSAEQLTLKPQNYAQVEIAPQSSSSQFVAAFLNSDLGVGIREAMKSGVIAKLNKTSVLELAVVLPGLEQQQEILGIDADIHMVQRVLSDVVIEAEGFRSDLWANPKTASSVRAKVEELSSRVGGDLRQSADEQLDRWLEGLPFPMASVLRAWRASQASNHKERHDHLLHFFEATVEFLAIIMLSGFSSNSEFFAETRPGLSNAIEKQHLSFERASFGTWKFVLEFLGKRLRTMLDKEASLCAELFSDDTLRLPFALSSKHLVDVFSEANRSRNLWQGHCGVLGPDEAARRNEFLVDLLQRFREATSEMWRDTQLISASSMRLTGGAFETDVSVLMGSNTEFLKDKRRLSVPLDADHLYVTRTGSARAMKLIPLVRFGPSPKSAVNACYFYNRSEGGRDARFVSYHYADVPELSSDLDSSEAAAAIRLLVGA